MLSRRLFVNCAICAITPGFAATAVQAQGQPAATSGVTRKILSTTELADGKHVTVQVAAEIAPGATVREVEDRLLKVVPKDYLHDAHHWLILHGRYVCVARKPKCPECLIRDLCEYPAKTTPEELQPGARRSATDTAAHGKRARGKRTIADKIRATTRRRGP